MVKRLSGQMTSKDLSYPEIGNGVTEQIEDDPNPMNLIQCPIQNNSLQQTLKEVNETPEAGEKGPDAGHGNKFQSKLLILYALRVISSGYQFYLGTELSVGEKFDDLILHYKDAKCTESDSNAITKKIYLQAKHRLDENKNITAANLLSDDNKTYTDTGDFSLLKYFQSYIKISRNNDHIEHCIICTNVDFHHNDFKKNGITLVPDDKENWPKLLDCTDVKPQQTCYKLKVAYDNFRNISRERKRKWIKNYTKDEIEYLFDCIKKKIPSLFINCQENVNGKPFSDYTADEMKDFLSKKSGKEMKKFLDTCEETIVAGIFEGFLSFLDDFLNTMVFAVKMPNEDELDDILTKEVRKYFHLSNADLQSAYVINKMVNWFKKQENLWLTAKDAEDFLKIEAGELMKINYKTSLSIDYQRQTLKLGVLKFEDEVVRQLTVILEEFWDSREKIKRIKSETPKLTAVKVISAIQKLTRFPNDDDCLVISSRKLKENIKELEESKRAERCHHLFVIVDEDAENPLENNTSYQNSIPPDIKKKIIVISKNVSPSDSTDPITFGKFHEDTKTKIRNIKVLFQGINKTVGDLIKESQIDSEFDSKFIENILYAENNETNSVPSFNSGFNPSLYIQRKLKLPFPDQLLNELADTLDNNISGQINRKNHGLLDKSEKDWDKKVDEFNKTKIIKIKEEIYIDSNGKIHWLIDDFKRKTEIWEKLKFLLRENDSRKISLLNIVNEEKLIDLGNKRIIITGLAGTGKSTILSHYYEEIKKINPDKLVIKISLMNYSKALMNEKSINEFLINNLMGKNAFARSLLKHRLEAGDRIILMFDGFDEIESECQNKVVELMKNLNELIPLYITTRPHLAGKLQFKLSQLAYSLDNFTEEDQINHLTKIWEKFINLEKETNKNYQKTTRIFATYLIKRVSETLNDKEKEFIGIPLQCRILAECFQSKIKNEVIQKPNADLSPLISEAQQLDFANLYQTLIDEKRRVFRQEKIKESSRESHIANVSIEYVIKKTECHLRKLAIQTIFYDHEDGDILFPFTGFQSESERKTEEKQLNEFVIRF